MDNRSDFRRPTPDVRRPLPLREFSAALGWNEMRMDTAVSAVEATCGTLYWEDLQDEQVIEGESPSGSRLVRKRPTS